MSVSVRQLEKYPRRRGRKELIRHLKGERITRGEAIKARCYECLGYCVDGAVDCEMPECPLYGYMPYRNKRESSESPCTAGYSDEHAGKRVEEGLVCGPP